MFSYSLPMPARSGRRGHVQALPDNAVDLTRRPDTPRRDVRPATRDTERRGVSDPMRSTRAGRLTRPLSGRAAHAWSNLDRMEGLDMVDQMTADRRQRDIAGEGSCAAGHRRGRGPSVGVEGRRQRACRRGRRRRRSSRLAASYETHRPSCSGRPSIRRTELATACATRAHSFGRWPMPASRAW